MLRRAALITARSTPTVSDVAKLMNSPVRMDRKHTLLSRVTCVNLAGLIRGADGWTAWGASLEAIN